VESRDAKIVRQIMRRLNVPDSRCSQVEFWDRTALLLGEADVEEWLRRQEDDTPDSQYDFTYSTLERALCCAVGWRSWPLEQECTWMLPRLREALSARGPDEQFVVEIGAGPGAASAVLSAALGVPFLAVDPHPLTAGLSEQIADRTGGKVTSVVAGAEDLARVLDGRVPAAVIGMGVFRYFQRHVHRDGVFSYSNSIANYLQAGRPDPQSVDFFQAIRPAELLLSEAACPDYVGEVATAAAASGYYFVEGGLSQMRTAIPTGPVENTLMHLACARLSPVSVPLLQATYSPLPAPRPGLHLEGPMAEALMYSLGPVKTLRLTELRWRDGTLRRAAFQYGELFGHYDSTDLDYRRLTFHSAAEWPAAEARAVEYEEETVRSGEAQGGALVLPVSAW
jgi:hypothetical protein